MELETIHLTTLAVTAVAILYADHLGYQYFTGKRETLNGKVTARLHTFVWIGLLAMSASGALLVYPLWEYWFSEPTFFIKMGLVLVLVMNAFVIGKVSRVTTDRAFKELPDDVQKTLLVSGALSGIGWIGATIIGYFFL